MMALRAKRKDPFLGARLFFIASRATESHIKSVKIERLLKGFCLHDIGVVRRAMSDGPDAFHSAARVGVGQEFKANFFGGSIPERDHLAELPTGVDMHQREWNRSWIKCL